MSLAPPARRVTIMARRISMVEGLALTVVSNLLLPYVKEGAEKLASAAVKAFDKADADKAVDRAKKAWSIVTGVFESSGDAETVKDFEKYPEDEKGRLARKLQEKIDQDPKLAGELRELAEEPVAPGGTNASQIIGATYAQITNISGTVSGGTITGMVIGAEPRPSSQAPTGQPPKQGGQG
jgi:hypothetical protein